MLKKQRLTAMEGKHHDKPPPYSRKVMVVVCPSCNGTGDSGRPPENVCRACCGTGVAK